PEPPGPLCYRTAADPRGARRARRGRARRRAMTKKILVVEDDATTADYVAKGLMENGYVVDRATDGRDGLFHALDGTYAAVILDRMLPGMDGLAVLGAIRAANVDTPVIILSALGST